MEGRAIAYGFLKSVWPIYVIITNYYLLETPVESSGIAASMDMQLMNVLIFNGIVYGLIGFNFSLCIPHLICFENATLL